MRGVNLSLCFETLFVYTVLLAYGSSHQNVNVVCEWSVILIYSHHLANNNHTIGCASNSWNFYENSATIV